MPVVGGTVGVDGDSDLNPMLGKRSEQITPTVDLEDKLVKRNRLSAHAESPNLDG
jgi:hypothetical protein